MLDEKKRGSFNEYTEKLNIDANHSSQAKLKAFTFNKHR